MTVFPPSLAAPLRAWRIDLQRHAAAWNSGAGAYLLGGRWNPRGVKAVYCSLDAATAILEVAVHKGFAALDAVAHVSTVLSIDAPQSVHVVLPQQLSEPDWLRPGIPGARQQAFGASLLAQHDFVALPSVVSRQSWNLVFDPDRVEGRYRQLAQEKLVIDERLHREAD